LPPRLIHAGRKGGGEKALGSAFEAQKRRGGEKGKKSSWSYPSYFSKSGGGEKKKVGKEHIYHRWGGEEGERKKKKNEPRQGLRF